MQLIRIALSLAELRAGNNNAARMAIMAMTTSSSISVNASPRLHAPINSLPRPEALGLQVDLAIFFFTTLVIQIPQKQYAGRPIPFVPARLASPKATGFLQYGTILTVLIYTRFHDFVQPLFSAKLLENSAPFRA